MIAPEIIILTPMLDSSTFPPLFCMDELAALGMAADVVQLPD